MKGYDIYYTSETYRGYSAQCARARIRHAKRLAVHVYENLPFAFEHHPILRSNKRITRNAGDVFIAASKRAASALMLEGVDADRIRVVYPGVDVAFFSPVTPPERVRLCRKHGFEPNDFVIMFAGRFHSSKGIGYLLHALDLLFLRRPELSKRYRLLLVGDGPERKFIKEFAASKPYGSRVHVISYSTTAALAELYKTASAFVLPSTIDSGWQEQVGQVLLEAMASGVPVVSTYSGSIDEVVGDAGLLVPPNDSFRLSETIERLASEKGLGHDLGTRGRARTMDRFSPETERSAMRQIFDEMADCPSAPIHRNRTD